MNINDIYYSILPIYESNLYLSEKPANDNEIPYFIEFYHTQNINTIIVLIPDVDLADFYSINLLRAYRDSGLHVIHFPINDYSVPGHLTTFHSFILDLVSRLKKGNILIHCSAGIGRTGLVASSILISNGSKVEDAIRQVREVRPGSVENAEQKRFLEDYFKSLK